MSRDNRKTKKYIHKIAKRAIKLKRRQHRRYTMGCPRGGSHNWRNHDRRHSDGSVFQQCSKCLQTREHNPVLKAIVIAIVIIVILIIGYYIAREEGWIASGLSTQLQNSSQDQGVLVLAMSEMS
jgi:hypothetical protein